MTSYLAAAAAGLGAGAVIALLALGLVVGYRGTGVVNFGHGAIAAWCAYVFAELRDGARYPLPIPGPWDAISLGSGRLTFIAAVALTVVTGAAIGALGYGLIFARMRTSPVLARIVAGVGLMLYLQALIGVRFDATSRALPKVVASGLIRVGDSVVIAIDAVWLAAGALAIAVGLSAISRFTRVGLAVRAAAESETAAVLRGLSPHRLGGGSFVVASILAAIVGIVAAPLFELTPLLFTRLLVPAFGAALLARLASPMIAAIAGISLGCLQAMTSPLQQDLDWLPRTGLREGLVFVVIAAVIVGLGQRLPTRAGLDAIRQPAVPDPQRTVTWVMAVAAASIAAFLALPADWGLALLTSVIFAGMALSLVVLTGFVGQISLAQASIAGVAGFSLSRLTQSADVPFPLAPLLAALVATVMGVAISAPALRVRGVNLAIVTLAGGIAIQEFVFKNPDFVGDVTTGGAKVSAPAIGGLDFSLQSASDPYRPHFGVFATIVVAAMAYVVARIRAGSAGRMMLAVRGNERAAATAGIDVAHTKLMAMAISSFIAGVAGTLTAYRFGSISDASYGLFSSLTLVAFAYLGGITSVRGALTAGALTAGGIGFKLLDSAGSADGGTNRWALVIGSIGLIAAAVAWPNGLAMAGRRRR